MSTDIDLEHVRIVRAEPGDVVVLATEDVHSLEQCRHASEKLKEYFPNNQCLVISRAELTVLRAQEARQDA